LPQCKEVKRLAFAPRILHHVGHAAATLRARGKVRLGVGCRRAIQDRTPKGVAVRINQVEHWPFAGTVQPGLVWGLASLLASSQRHAAERGLSYIWPSCYVTGAGTSSISLRHLTVRGDNCCYLAWERVWKTFARKHLLATGGCPVPSARSAANFCYAKSLSFPQSPCGKLEREIRVWKAVG